MTAKQKYNAHKSCAKQRNIPFTLTFDEWYNIWIQSGKWEQRGRGRDRYVMSRKNDLGGYELDNVFIQSNLNNVIEGNKNRIISEKTKLKHKFQKQKSTTKEHIIKMHKARAERYGYALKKVSIYG